MDEKNPTVPKNQHYVPQFLLQGFCPGSKEQLFVFEKSSGRVFPSSIRNVASENGFYNFEGGTAETDLANMETDCGKIFQTIRESRTVQGLSHEERTKLDIFIAIQILRGKNMRSGLKSMNDHIGKLFEATGGSPANIPQLGNLDEESIKLMSIRNLKLTENILPNISNKRMLLLDSSEESSFHISDTPVVLGTSFPKPPEVGVGLETLGVEIQLPISSSQTLLLVCSDLVEPSKMEFGTPTHWARPALPCQLTR